MLYFFFINDFKMYKNIYKVLKFFYLIFIYLNYNERRKIINVFTLILKSYNAKLNNVVKVFIKFIENLNREMKLKINDNIKTIWAFNITFFKNIL